MMKRMAALLAGLMLLAACGAQVTPTVGVTPAPTKVSPTATPVPAAANLPLVSAGGPREFKITDEIGYVNTYYIDPWLQNPTPREGEYVLVRPRLYKNGWRVGGMPIIVQWPQGGTVQRCQIMPFYMAGCVINVQGFVPGVQVPITMTIGYSGSEFIDYTGFTPQ